MAWEEILVETPLYAPLNIDSTTLHDLEQGAYSLDCYCIECGRNSVFFAGKVERSFELMQLNHVFVRPLLCTRNQTHIIHFVLMRHGKEVQKIGQWPSLADIAQASLRKYKGVLDADDHRELVKAVGLVSHGVGVGSFVYLRRIFERLIEEAHQKGKANPNWDEETYVRSRMDGKIQALRSRLPAFLVEQHSMYGIISKGLHELSEQECLENFPLVRDGIELILDEKLALKEQQRKTDEARKKLNALKEKMGGPTAKPAKPESPSGPTAPRGPAASTGPK